MFAERALSPQGSGALLIHPGALREMGEDEEERKKSEGKKKTNERKKQRNDRGPGMSDSPGNVLGPSTVTDTTLFIHLASLNPIANQLPSANRYYSSSLPIKSNRAVENHYTAVALLSNHDDQASYPTMKFLGC